VNIFLVTIGLDFVVDNFDAGIGLGWTSIFSSMWFQVLQSILKRILYLILLFYFMHVL